MRILLVEEDPTTAKSIELMLTHANLNFHVTDLGEEAIDLAKLYDYDFFCLISIYQMWMGMMSCVNRVWRG